MIKKKLLQRQKVKQIIEEFGVKQTSLIALIGSNRTTFPRKLERGFEQFEYDKIMAVYGCLLRVDKVASVKVDAFKNIRSSDWLRREFYKIRPEGDNSEFSVFRDEAKVFIRKRTLYARIEKKASEHEADFIKAMRELFKRVK